LAVALALPLPSTPQGLADPFVTPGSC